MISVCHFQSEETPHCQLCGKTKQESNSDIVMIIEEDDPFEKPKQKVLICGKCILENYHFKLVEMAMYH